MGSPSRVNSEGDVLGDDASSSRGGHGARRNQKGSSSGKGHSSGSDAAREAFEKDREKMDKIIAMLGVSTMDESIVRVSDLQEANFSLLKYNAEIQEANQNLAQENENLKKQLIAVQHEQLVQDDKAAGTSTSSYVATETTSSSSSGHNMVIKNLEDRLEEAHAVNERLQSRYEKVSLIYVDVKAGVEALCAKVGVPVQQMDVVQSADQNLHNTVADERVVQNLQRLETRILEILNDETVTMQEEPAKAPARGSSFTGRQPYSRSPSQSDLRSPTQKTGVYLNSLKNAKDSVISVSNVSKFLNQMVEESDSDDEVTELLDRERLKQLSLQKIKEKEAEENDERLRKTRFQKKNANRVNA
jgi:hypothetical protein